MFYSIATGNIRLIKDVDEATRAAISRERRRNVRTGASGRARASAAGVRERRNSGSAATGPAGAGRRACTHEARAHSRGRLAGVRRPVPRGACGRRRHSPTDRSMGSISTRVLARMRLIDYPYERGIVYSFMSNILLIMFLSKHKK